MVIFLGVPHKGWFISLDVPREDGHSIGCAQGRIWSFSWACPKDNGHSLGHARGLAHCQAQHDRGLTYCQTQSHPDLATTRTRMPGATTKLNRVWVWLVSNPTLLGLAHYQAQSRLVLASGRHSVSGAWPTAKSNCVWVWLTPDLVCLEFGTLPSPVMFESN
jgi:hypothetical protein